MGGRRAPRLSGCAEVDGRLCGLLELRRHPNAWSDCRNWRRTIWGCRIICSCVWTSCGLSTMRKGVLMPRCIPHLPSDASPASLESCYTRRRAAGAERLMAAVGGVRGRPGGGSRPTRCEPNGVRFMNQKDRCISTWQRWTGSRRLSPGGLSGRRSNGFAITSRQATYSRSTCRSAPEPADQDGLARELYEWLRLVNPSPYMGYMRRARISSSCRLRRSCWWSCADGKLATRPIAGTRRRGRTAEEDRRMAEELLATEKERAEHIMLVDLERNDLGPDLGLRHREGRGADGHRDTTAMSCIWFPRWRAGWRRAKMRTM